MIWPLVKDNSSQLQAGKQRTQPKMSGQCVTSWKLHPVFFYVWTRQIYRCKKQIRTWWHWNKKTSLLIDLHGICWFLGLTIMLNKFGLGLQRCEKNVKTSHPVIPFYVKKHDNTGKENMQIWNIVFFPAPNGPFTAWAERLPLFSKRTGQCHGMQLVEDETISHTDSCRHDTSNISYSSGGLWTTAALKLGTRNRKSQRIHYYHQRVLDDIFPCLTASSYLHYLGPQKKWTKNPVGTHQIFFSPSVEGRCTRQELVEHDPSTPPEFFLGPVARKVDELMFYWLWMVLLIYLKHSVTIYDLGLEKCCNYIVCLVFWYCLLKTMLF